uniref:Uncharacterized protein n=1 Tax=Anguilla anguilla TaxID=7936 RepID=A0A0E9PUV0_ANGAN
MVRAHLYPILQKLLTFTACLDGFSQMLFLAPGSSAWLLSTIAMRNTMDH